MQIQTKLPKVGQTIFTVMSQLATEHQAVNLGQGFPDFSLPQRLVEELARAIAEGKNQYPPSYGIPELREAIAAKTAHVYGRMPDADTEITVTNGASEALFDALHAVVRPGDEVILLDPCFDTYEPGIELAGGRAVHVALDPPDFAVDWERIRDAISPRTRMLILNSPHNPSGAMVSRADMETLAEILRDTEIVLLSDEVYEHITFEGRRHESALLHPELAERAIVVSSLGKTYHCTGWKVGYAIAPPALSVELRKVHQYNSFTTFAPAQWAFASMIREEPEHHEGLGAFYQGLRDGFREQLAGTRLEPLPVQGGYFQLVDYSAISDLPDAEFCRWLAIQKGVAAIPLSPFYETPPPGQRLIRLCFAKIQPTLDEAVERLARL